MENNFQHSYTGGMSEAAMGAYIQVIRDYRDMTQEELGELVGFTGRSISEWETGKTSPKSNILAKIVEIIQADPAEVHRLMVDEQADAEAGRTAAFKWIAHLPPENQKQVKSAVNAVPVDQRARIAAQLRRMASDLESGQAK